jgi:hypothetical protein
MVVIMSTSAVAQSALPSPVSNSATSIEAASELPKRMPVDERTCAGVGGIVLVNAVCFPRKACATTDAHNIERVACLASEPAAEDLEIQRPAATRRAPKNRQHKK